MPPESFEEFKKRNPHLDSWWPYQDLLQAESPRGQVLISMGFLEEQLKQILLAFLIDGSGSTNLIAKGNAPLGTLSARIEACFALGLITEHEHHDLNQLRKIRNDFAHDIHTTFKTQSVVDRCKTLRLKAHDYDSEELGEVRVDPNGQFTTSAVALIMNLINRAHYVSKDRRKTKSWQI